MIFLSGKSGAGKDLAAKHLSDEYGYSIFRIATTIKQIAATITGSSLLDCYFKKGKVPEGMGDLNFDLGEYQQKIGKSLRDGIHPDIFLFSLWKEIQESKEKKIVIVDGRYKNEYKFFVEKEAKSIRINRKYELRKEHLGKRDRYHKSEINLDDEEFDFVIENHTMNKEDLFKKIKLLSL